MTTKAIDHAGVALSSLCIIHCVLLPLVISTLPIVAILSENEIIHKALVFLAIIPAAFAFSGRITSKFSFLIRIVGMAGIALLFLGAFVERLHDFETLLTLTGATLLTSAHVLRLLRNRPHSHDN